MFRWVARSVAPDDADGEAAAQQPRRHSTTAALETFRGSLVSNDPYLGLDPKKPLPLYEERICPEVKVWKRSEAQPSPQQVPSATEMLADR
jgi:hypothetical protein